MKSLGCLLTAAALGVTATSLDASQSAVLRNGFTISHDHQRPRGATTRPFLSASEQEYVDVATGSIASFEKEEPPVEALPKPESGRASAPDLDQIVERVARENQLDPDFIRAVMGAESRGNATAVSPKGAPGLMQLRPETAAGLGVKNAFDSAENVSAGTRYPRALLARYHNDSVRGLAAYNAGAGRVQQYQGLPPFRETRAYVAGIIRDFNHPKLAQLKAPAQKTVRSLAGNHPVDGN